MYTKYEDWEIVPSTNSLQIFWKLTGEHWLRGEQQKDFCHGYNTRSKESIYLQAFNTRISLHFVAQFGIHELPRK